MDIRRRLAVLCNAACLVASQVVVTPVFAAASPDPAPNVTPALRQWTGASGTFRLGQGARIVVAPAQAADARTFRDDLAAITGQALPVVPGDTTHPGDLRLVVDPAAPATLGEEGYQLQIADTLTVRGRTPAGVAHGTQTVEQLFTLAPDRAQVPHGTAMDWPDVRQRGFMLDAGRKYYRPEYILQQIRTAAWLKLNTVHLHLTEHNAFRLVSDQFPGLAAADAYTKADIRRFEDEARKYHVTLLPEIDLPGHSNAIAQYRPDLKFSCPALADGWTLDVTKQATRDFVKKLLDEFVPLFDGPEFHVGTDEYQTQATQEQCPELVDYAREHGYASTADVFVDFINFMNKVVRSHDKRAVIWNWWDYQQTPSTAPDKNIKVEAWVGDGVQHYLDLGYDVVASPGDLLYVTPGAPPGGALLPDDRSLYAQWTPTQNDHLTGYLISRWSDSAETQSDAYFDWFANRPQQVLADRAWGGPRQGTSFDFEDRIDRLGPPPGVAYPPTGTVKLTGASYGAGPAYGGSDNTYDKVFDGDPNTAYDYEKADGGYAGIDLGAGHTARVAKIRFVPRAGQAGRMVGGRFQGCTDGPDKGCVDLATVPWTPMADWTQLTVEDNGRYRWLRYVSPPGGFANIAEAEFDTAPETPGRLDVAAPGTLRALGHSTVTTTFTNTGTSALNDVRQTLTAYATSSVVPLAARPIGDPVAKVVAPGHSVSVHWQADLPLDVMPGTYRLTGGATWAGGGRTTGAAAVKVPAPLTATADPGTLVVSGGKDATATVRLTSAADAPLTARWAVNSPSGVTARPASGTVHVPAGGTASVRVTVTAGDKPGAYDLPVALTAQAGGGRVDVTAPLRVSVPYPALSGAFDNTGATDDGTPAPDGLNGGIDSDGSSYSAQALAAAGVTRGGTFTYDGQTFTWPDAAPGTPDNVLANGQTIKVGEQGGRLGLLTVGTYGPIGGTGLVTYADGSTQPFTVTDPDWQVPSLPGDAKAAITMPYHNLAGTGRVNRTTYVFTHEVALDPAKTVASVTLPTVSSTARGGLHVFALTVSSS
ncbi:family 20 glycosylhydrolase [Actinoallomurus sp. NBC_01490]|uniref:family 20 glycosylhydrolase n=1 Tax=Actinoallomurus sp. NBC_01490 TaxID=2903557 RepID=UPI002E350C2B|nr:family 20 glycosylhydrolase [Actinoallomurus sp. NBC_01490]